MSNYQDESSGGYETPGAGSGPYPSAQPGGYAGGMPPGQGGQPYETQRLPPAPPGQQWQGQPGYEQHGGRGPFGHGGRRSVNVPRALKSTEFWVFVVVSIGVLIAAAVTDAGDDGQGFGAREAWKYITALAIAYIVSRGLRKFGGEEHDDHDHRRH
jgi:hypothetical protein